jgi:peptidyl-prolyl cis-trans isomerase D
MLQKIREGGKWVFGVLLGLIALSFVFFGIDFNIGVPTFAAKVNGEEVPLLEFQQRLQSAESQYANLYRAEFTDEIRRQIRNDVLQTLVRREALQQQVEGAGYRVSDERLTEAIRGIPEFQIDGEFSMEVYQSKLRNQGYNPESFELMQRSDLGIRELQQGVADSTFFTAAEFRQYIELVNERREIAYALFPADRFAEGVELEAGAVEAFYEANQALFMTEEAVDLEYLRITRASIASSLNVSDAQLREFYDQQAAAYASDEQRQARHILLTGEAAEQRAVAALERVRGGEDFAAVAAEVSEDGGTKAAGGDLGWVGRGTLVGPFEDTLFSLSQGEVAGPVETEFGFHIIRLDGVQAPDNPPFESIQGQLRDDFLETQVDETYYARANELEDAAFDALTGLASVAEVVGLPLQRVNGFTRRGGVPEFPMADPVVQAAFSEEVLGEGKNSPLLELGEEVVVIRVAEHHFSQPRTLDEVRETITARLIQQQAEARAAAQGAALMASLGEGADPAALVAEQSGSWHPARWVARAAVEEDIPAEVVAGAFGLNWSSDGGVKHQGVALANGDYAVVELSRREPGQPQTISREERDNRKEQLARQTAIFELTAYVGQVTEDAKVQIPEQVAEGDF